MNFKILTLSVLTSVAFASCSDDFLQDKKNYDNVTSELYNSYIGAKGRVDNLYAWCLPDANSNPGARNNSTGLADDQSKCTEEYSGFGVFVDPQSPLTTMSGTNPVPDYFQAQANSIMTSAWGRIRNINEVIGGIQRGTLSQEEKNELLGQALFLRAWCYYNFVKWYGGVPIIREWLDTTSDSFTPRSSTKDCIEFICEDLDNAAEMLKVATTGGWSDASNYGRVTSGTALALKGRVLLLWASPIFNRTNDRQRWQDAFDAISASIPVINSCGYALAYETNPGTNAEGWAKMFSEINQKNSEAIFVSLYNTIASGGVPDYSHNNGWEHGIRPSNTRGGGGKTPSAMIVDLFPMRDGKHPSKSSVSYDSNYPFMDRDPRFYRTFAFPGVRWAFDGEPNNAGMHSQTGKDFELWNYVWYSKDTDRENVESGNNYGPDNLLGNVKGMYVRKRTDDLDVNGSPRYVFNTSNGFRYSASPYMEIRYAEVLLNYAEAACMIGRTDIAVEQLKRIRHRVGYADGMEGLDGLSSQNACMAAILYERQVELAFEGKRFDDMRRWMLFDGGAVAVPGAPSSWNLTGWDGNTCAWLGVRPMNGQRRDNMEFRVTVQVNGGLGGEKYGADGSDPDPLANVARCAAVDLRNSDLTSQLNTLKSWYNNRLERNKKKGDAYTSDKQELFIDFQPRYYLLGFSQGAMSNNVGLPQCIGWDDFNTGGPGTFDPLAE